MIAEKEIDLVDILMGYFHGRKKHEVGRIVLLQLRESILDRVTAAGHHLNQLKSQPVPTKVDNKATTSPWLTAPWKVFSAENGTYIGVGDAEARGVLDYGFGVWGDESERKAAAEMIVTAVNQYLAQYRGEVAGPADGSLGRSPVERPVTAVDDAPHVHARDPRESLVVRAIEAHKAAVAEDELMFNDKGEPISKVAAAATLTAEIAAYRNFVQAPCRSNSDVQAKVRYILDGTVGERDLLIDLLMAPEYCGDDDLEEEFYRSLLVERV